MGVWMMYKVGDRVVNVKSGYILADGNDVTTGVVTEVYKDGDVRVWFDGLKKSLFCYEKEVIAAEPIGKTLTELDVKPGDVVRGVDCTFADEKDFTCVNILAEGHFIGEHTMTSESYGSGIFGDIDGKWLVVSRAPQPAAEPIKPQRMHPDDVAEAMMQYAHDCGYVTEVIKIRSENGSYVYDI